jgi:hypothetical protein
MTRKKNFSFLNPPHKQKKTAKISLSVIHKIGVTDASIQIQISLQNCKVIRIDLNPHFMVFF